LKAFLIGQQNTFQKQKNIKQTCPLTHRNVRRTEETTRQLVRAVTLATCLPKMTGSNLSRCICNRPCSFACLCSLSRRETGNNTQNYAVAIHKSFPNYYSQITLPFDTAGHNWVPDTDLT